MIVWRCLAAGLAASLATKACGGILLSSSLAWSAFAFRPANYEDSPNYRAVGPAFAVGYSYARAFDGAAYVNYIPGTQKNAKFGKEDAHLLLYGLELALRVNDAVFLGLRGGVGRYKFIKLNTDFDVPGEWQGNAAGFVLGAIHKVDKHNFWQLSLLLHHAMLARQLKSPSNGANDLRRIDAFSLAVSYTFIGGFSGGRSAL